MKNRLQKIIAVVSGKGGVGKSLLTAGLGYTLALRGNSVLLVDNNPGLCSLDHILGISEQTVFDMSDIVKGSCEVYKAIYSSGIDGLDLIIASKSYDETISKELFAKVLNALSKRYDYILIDSAPGLGHGFECAANSADSALVISTTYVISVNACEKIRQKLARNNINDIRLIINKFSADEFFRYRTFKDLDEIIDACCIRLIAVIPDDKNIKMLSEKSVSIYKYDKSSAILALKRLAARLEGKDTPLVI